ncbi:carbohydrate binding domain-containing protein [Robiginitalea sp. IMCC44478]|uniref:carbohydrate binding domain-containing protein n=1 Tax=Robiginitalea sp. IMCC44478 TaxID=3459122 RepID=UPI004042FB4E
MKPKGIPSLLFGLIFLTLSTVHSQNLLTNGDFGLTTEIISNFDGPPPENVWISWLGDNAAANASIGNEQLHYQISNSGNQSFEVQLFQAGFTLKSGHTYKLSFDVKADANRTFGVFLGEYGGNWTSLLGFDNYTQNATTEWGTITIEFDVYTVFPTHKLSFEFGAIDASVYLDNVSLIDLGVTEKTNGTDSKALNKKIRYPAYRPESVLEKAFTDSYKEAATTLYPTITRQIDTTTFSKALSEAFAQNLKADENLNILLSGKTLDPGELMGKSQFQFFMYDMVRLGNEIKIKGPTTEYHIIPEILFGPKRQGTLFVFGIHVFILDKEGENVFSFLLNSHHELFVDAKLFSYNPDNTDIEALLQRCLQVAARAFSIMVH